jgi:hypothetical protein
MGQQIDLYLDTGANALVAAGSVKNGVFPTLTRNDTYTLRVRLQARDSSGLLRDIDTTGASLKLGIGYLDGKPTDGQFKLTTSTGTSTAISFNSTTAQVATAISAIAGNCTVTTYGSVTNGAWVITAVTANTALSFGGSSFTLFPTSSVLINTRRYPAVSVNAQQIIQLSRNPAVYSDTFTAASTAGVVSLTQLQVGSSGTTGTNQTWRLSVGPDAEGGNIVLNYGANSTTGIAIGATAASFSEALSAVTGIGSGNISVQAGNNQGDYTISFVRNLGQQNVTTALTLDASGVVFGKFFQSTVTMATSELDELYAEAGTSTITPKLEIELTQSGTPKTIYQGDVTVRKDLVSVGSAVPAAAAGYYTKAECDALFVEDSNTNVDATNRKLYNSGGSVFLDWQNNTIGTGATVLDLSGTAVTITDGYNLGLGTATGTKFGVSTSSKLAFYGSTPVTQPNGPNVVTSLVNLGLLRTGSTTYGVLPLSVETLTTTASLAFGTVNSNSSTSITVAVTGAAINDIVLLGIPSAVSEGLTFFGHVVATDQVHVDAVNATGAGKNQSTQTFRITVIGY